MAVRNFRLEVLPARNTLLGLSACFRIRRQAVLEMPANWQATHALAEPRLRTRLMQQEREQQREAEQCRHSLPDLDGGSFIKGRRPGDLSRGARRSGFHFQRKFAHVAKTLGGIGCNCPAQYSLEPGWKVRAEGGKLL